MSAALLTKIEHNIWKIGEELWNIDGPDNVLDGVLKRLSLLTAQLQVQKTLQATANLLRQQPQNKALPKQQATKVKRILRAVFEKSKEGRLTQLRNIDCDALKVCGLSYTIEELSKLGDAEFEILQNRVPEFISRRGLSSYLYRPDMDKAVDSKFEDADFDEAFDTFLQSHTARRLSTRKRKYNTIAFSNEATQKQEDDEIAACGKREPSQALIEKDPELEGDCFAVALSDALHALSAEDSVGDIYLTNPKIDGTGFSDGHGNKAKKAFLTAWIAIDMGQYLGRRSQPLGY